MNRTPGLVPVLLAVSVAAAGCMPVLIGTREPFDSTGIVVPPVVGAPSPESAVWLTAGQRVRVTAPSAGIIHQTATLVGMSGDSIVLGALGAKRGDAPALSDRSRRAVPLGSVTSLEISRGTGSNRGGGAIVGALVGAVGGGVLGGSGGCDLEIGLRMQHFSCTVLGAVGGAVVGAGVGALVGGALHSERWEQVPLDQLRRVRVSSVPGGRVRRYGVQTIMLGHCTGVRAFGQLASAFPGRCTWPASGTTVEFGGR